MRYQFGQTVVVVSFTVMRSAQSVTSDEIDFLPWEEALHKTHLVVLTVVGHHQVPSYREAGLYDGYTALDLNNEKWTNQFPVAHYGQSPYKEDMVFRKLTDRNETSWVDVLSYLQGLLYQDFLLPSTVAAADLDRARVALRNHFCSLVSTYEVITGLRLQVCPTYQEFTDGRPPEIIGGDFEVVIEEECLPEEVHTAGTLRYGSTGNSLLYSPDSPLYATRLPLAEEVFDGATWVSLADDRVGNSYLDIYESCFKFFRVPHPSLPMAHPASGYSRNQGILRVSHDQPVYIVFKTQEGHISEVLVRVLDLEIVSRYFDSDPRISAFFVIWPNSRKVTAPWVYRYASFYTRWCRNLREVIREFGPSYHERTLR